MIMMHSLKNPFSYVYLNIFLLLNLCCFDVYAVDVIKANIGESTLDTRITFKREILQAALDHTKEEYGEYDIEVHNYYMNAKRGFIELVNGSTINVYFAITQPLWEEKAIAIRIPVRRGLVSYRLLIINSATAEEFAQINTVDELRKKRAGLNDGWTTYQIMEKQKFDIVNVADYDGMFNMLSVKRFDYLLRGVNEIFDEVDQRLMYNPELMIEPHLAVYLPSVTYVFVSKREPRIARRLQRGLEIMSTNGDLERIFDKFYGPSLKKAELDKRTIITIDNPDLPKSVPIEKKHLWFDVEVFKARMSKK